MLHVCKILQINKHECCNLSNILYTKLSQSIHTFDIACMILTTQHNILNVHIMYCQCVPQNLK
jgi:hypothetical protein